MRHLGIVLCWALCAASGSRAAAEPTPLVEAARAGDLPAIQALLQAGTPADAPDDNKCTALNWAAYEGHLDIAAVLLEKGATVDSRCNKASWTPLMNAAARGHQDIAALLLDHGANINARSTDGGFTPLMYAARMNRKDAMTVLINRGAPINERSDEKRTALDFAEDAEIKAALTARGAITGPKN